MKWAFFLVEFLECVHFLEMVKVTLIKQARTLNRKDFVKQFVF